MKKLLMSVFAVSSFSLLAANTVAEFTGAGNRVNPISMADAAVGPVAQNAVTDYSMAWDPLLAYQETGYISFVNDANGRSYISIDKDIDFQFDVVDFGNPAQQQGHVYYYVYNDQISADDAIAQSIANHQNNLERSVWENRNDLDLWDRITKDGRVFPAQMVVDHDAVPALVEKDGNLTTPFRDPDGYPELVEKTGDLLVDSHPSLKAGDKIGFYLEDVKGNIVEQYVFSNYGLTDEWVANDPENGEFGSKAYARDEKGEVIYKVDEHGEFVRDEHGNKIPVEVEVVDGPRVKNTGLIVNFDEALLEEVRNGNYNTEVHNLVSSWGEGHTIDSDIKFEWNDWMKISLVSGAPLPGPLAVMLVGLLFAGAGKLRRRA